jgi:pyridoxal 5'-phosphate synthase pdxT subunit
VAIDTPVIGVLALQGAVREHAAALKASGAEYVAVKWPDQLAGVDGLIIPGGESTTIGKLMTKYGFIDAIRDFASAGKPVYGTCAGLIVVAKRITEGTAPWLALMDIEARRNAFGRQQESFEAELDIPVLGKQPFTGVFIRAPWIEAVGPGVEILACQDGHIVMARESTLLATAFHPELTDDRRIHEYFIEMVKES